MLCLTVSYEICIFTTWAVIKEKNNNWKYNEGDSTGKESPWHGKCHFSSTKLVIFAVVHAHIVSSFRNYTELPEMDHKTVKPLYKSKFRNMKISW